MIRIERTDAKMRWPTIFEDEAMQAIEATGKVNSQGHLQLDQPLSDATERRVRVIVLFAEPDGDIDEREWCEAAASNPSFAFLSS